MKTTPNIANVQLAVLRDAGVVGSSSPLKVLDLGCGNGSTVKGWANLGVDAYGCDFSFKPGPDVERLSEEGRISLIAGAPYRLPYPDGHFDVLVTNQVMEHVRDYPATLAETRRVIKPNGCCLHIFPARGLPLEPHVFVPFGTRFQTYAWLAFWARLGVRKPGRENVDWRETAQQNFTYLKSSTNYLTGVELEKEFREHFSEFHYLERYFLANSPNTRGRLLFRWGSRFPILFRAYRTCWSRVILVRP